MRVNACLTGFSVAEALVAAMVFSIAAAGVFSTIGSVQKPSAGTDRSLQAAYIGQQVLEGLRSSVDAGTWDDSTTPSPLYGTVSGTPHACPALTPALPANWSCSYTVTEDPNSKARKVDVNVIWPNP